MQLFAKAERAMEVSHKQPTQSLEDTLSNYRMPGRQRLLDCFSHGGIVATAANHAFTIDFFVAEQRIANLRCHSVRPPSIVTAESSLPLAELRRRALSSIQALGPFPASVNIDSDGFDEQVAGIYRARLGWTFHGLRLNEGPSAIIELSRNSGGLMSFQAGSPFPAWNPALAVRGSTSPQCLLSAQAIYLQAGALPYANVDDVGYVYGYPIVGNGSAVQWQTQDPQYRELLASRKAILMYRVEYGWKIAYIDGRNGNPISVVGFDLGYGRSAGEATKVKEQIEGVAWNVVGATGTGKLRVLTSERGATKKANAVLKATNGKRIVSGNYDTESKTLRLGLGEVTLVLKPDDTLSKILSSRGR